MRYRNTRTGVVIEIKSRIHGGFWEEIPEPKVCEAVEETAQKKRTKKKDE